MGAHDATPIATPTYGLAKFGQGLTAGSLSIGGSLVSSAGTLEAWVSSTASGAVQVACGNSTSQIWLGIDANGNAAFGRPGLAVSGTVKVNDGAFHHLAMTVSGTVFTLWVDGVQAGTSTYTSTFNLPASTAIGVYGAANTYPFSGKIDEIRVSNNVRYSAAFSVPTSAFAVDSNTVALFHLDGDGSDAVPDTDPPTTPTALTTTPGPGSLTLSWTASTDASGAPSYEIYRGTSSPVTVNGTPYATVGRGTTQYTDVSVSNPTTYYYAVKAVDTSGNRSAASSEASGVPDAGATITIAPTDATVLYSPYNWAVDGLGGMRTINPGAYFRIAVTGAPTKVELRFNLTGLATPLPILKYRIDGGNWQQVTVTASVSIGMPSSNAWPDHLVELVVQSTSEFVNRWNPQAAFVSFAGANVVGSSTPGTRVLTPSGRRVLVLGDSITEAYKTLLNVTTPDGSDATTGWAYELGRLLGAEVGVVGFGGQAWTASGQGGVPKLASSYTSMWGGGPARDFSNAPDVIVIEMGHNDGSADKAAVTTEAVTVLQGLLAATPAKTWIVVLRPFANRQAAPLQAAVAQVGSRRVRYVDTSGWWTTADSLDAVHPTGAANLTKIAPLAAAAVRAAMAPRSYLNVGGQAVPTRISRF